MSDNAAVKLYGIRNCDTMQKAMSWLDEHGVAFDFVDYKKSGVVAGRLPHWLATAGHEVLLNRRGLMWKKLDAAQRENVDAAKATELMLACPTLIKRPVLEIGDEVLVGFDSATYTQRLTRK
jgi:arsenate reductase